MLPGNYSVNAIIALQHAKNNDLNRNITKSEMCGHPTLLKPVNRN